MIYTVYSLYEFEMCAECCIYEQYKYPDYASNNNIFAACILQTGANELHTCQSHDRLQFILWDVPNLRLQEVFVRHLLPLVVRLLVSHKQWCRSRLLPISWNHGSMEYFHAILIQCSLETMQSENNNSDSHLWYIQGVLMLGCSKLHIPADTFANRLRQSVLWTTGRSGGEMSRVIDKYSNFSGWEASRPKPNAGTFAPSNEGSHRNCPCAGRLWGAALADDEAAWGTPAAAVRRLCYGVVYPYNVPCVGRTGVIVECAWKDLTVLPIPSSATLYFRLPSGGLLPGWFYTSM